MSTPGLCEQHRKARHQAYNADRAREADPIDRLYHTARWQRVRAQQLRDEPACRMCRETRALTPATLVDHVVPVKQGGDFWSRGNLQSLCNHCHELKSHAEGSRFAPHPRV